jgi:hypothetical protein
MNWSNNKRLIRNYWALAVFVALTGIFFWKFFLKGWLPIPADTIVGMYHPWRDKIWDNLTGGVHFKNFLITDPVRQLYPWRKLVIDILKIGKIPYWNPYNLSGTPLLANMQSAPFSIFNLILLPLNNRLFAYGWGVLIFLQPLLAGIFLYFYLKELKLNPLPSLLGALSFAFGGFFMAWLEWGTVLYSALWLPFILLSIEKILIRKKFFAWGPIFVFALSQSFFAGHLQTFFYVFLFSIIYLIWRLFRFNGDKLKTVLLFAACYLLFVIITAPQWLPIWQFIGLSARGIDQADWRQPGWFIPWQNLIQFLSPDFFGNPATLNYWGIWNYAEFIGFIGVIPLLLAFLSLSFIINGKIKFFAFFGLIALSFALPTPWAKLPYLLKFPLLSTGQPTRIIMLIDFCLSVLAAFGAQKVMERKQKIWPILGLISAYGILWLIVSGKHMDISRRNLILPTAISGSGAILILLLYLKKIPSKLIVICLLALSVFDLFRFGWKFLPFVKTDYLFPTTQTLDFIKKDQKVYRVMTTDRRILPPNFSVAYKIQTIDGYDPLYFQRYGELVTALERGKPDTTPPFGFNRIITPQNYSSRLIDLLNVKYILSLTDLNLPKLGLVFQEGETRLYYNKDFFPRAFMVYNYRFAENKQEAIEMLMDEKINLKQKVILEESLPADIFKLTNEKIINSAIIEKYNEGEVLIDVRTNKKGFLVLTDSFYPGWRAYVDDAPARIYRANYNFRMVIVPMGEHKVKFIFNKYGN